MNNNILNILGVILLALTLQACDKPNDSNTATLSVRLSGDVVDQLNGSLNSRDVSGKPTGINRIIITVENLSTGAVIGSGDILQSNNSITFTVPTHVKMRLTGNGYANNSLQFIGETEVPALRPGDSATPTLTLEQLPTAPPQAGRVLTGTLSVDGFGAGSTIELYRVIVGAEPSNMLVAVGTFPSNDSNFSITLPEDTNPTPDSAYVFVAIDDINADPPIQLEARFTNNNVNLINNTLKLDNRTTAVSEIITLLTDSGNIQDLSTEITLDEIAELDTLVTDIEEYLGNISDVTNEAYTAAILDQVTTNLDYRGIASSIATRRQICGNVKLNRPDISIDPIAGIRIQVHDFDNSILRARTTTKADGSYCVDVPEAGEINAIASVSDSKGAYIIGAMNIDGQTNAGSGWWEGDNTRPATPLRIDAQKVLINSRAIELAAVANPLSVDFILRQGVAVIGKVQSQSRQVGKSGLTMIIRDSKTHFRAMATKTKADGSYEMHVPPGDYIIEAQNTTPLQTDVSQNVSTAYYTGPNYVGAIRRNRGTIITLSTNTPSQPFDMLLGAGIYVTGRLTDSAGIGISGERVVINMSTDAVEGSLADGSATQLRIKKTDGRFGIWLSQYNYDIFIHGHQQYFRIGSTPPGTSYALPTDFTGSVATLPVRLSNTTTATGAKLSQIKFELYNVSAGTTLVHTAFSKSDGSVTLYSNLPGDHILVGRLDSDRNTQQPYASTVYGGPDTGFTQRGIGERIPLTPGTIAPTLNFKPLSAGGTLTGTVVVSIANNQPASNVLVRVFHTVSNNATHNPIFTQTRTRSDGTYTLNLPQATYDKITFEKTGNFGLPRELTTVCAFTPIFANKTTTLDAQLDSELNNICTRTPNIAPPPYIQVGNAYFDPATSADLALHPLYSNIAAGWVMQPLNQQNPILNYAFATPTPIEGEVSFAASSRNLDYGEAIDTVIDNLAIGIGGGLYSLGSGSGTNPTIVPYTNPVLQIPGELAIGITWDISDGADLANSVILKQGKIESFDLTSNGTSAVGNVHISKTQNVSSPIVEDFYFRKGGGLQEEIITNTAPPPTVTDSWVRAATPPL